MKRFLSLALIVTSTAFIPAIAQTHRATPTTRATQGKPARPQPTPTPIATTTPAPMQAEDCGCEGEPLPEVVATVNGVKINKQDIDSPVKAQIDELKKSVIEARQRELDLQINSKLLEAEAKKRGMTTAKLLEEEVAAKVREPTEADAQTFYDANRAKITGDFKDVKADIISFLRDGRQREQAKILADRLRAAAVVKIEAPAATPPHNAAERARVLAVVNGVQLTSAQVEDSLKPLIYNVQERAFQLRMNEIDLRINDTLLEQEAQKRKLTTKALLDAELNAKVKPVTEVEAQAFYTQNKERINGDYAALKDQIIQYLQDTQMGNLQTSFAGQLRQGAALQVFLRAPEPPIFEIAINDQPVKGNPAAPVTIIEFTDFQCPSCAAAQPALEKLLAEYGDRLRLVVRDYPLQRHKDAFRAAEAAEAARAQGKYWEYSNLLFTNQTALGVDKLKEYATRVGLDRQKFDAMLDSGQMAGKVQRDMNDGNLLALSGTPTFFINGQIAREITYEGLKASIEKALGEKGKK